MPGCITKPSLWGGRGPGFDATTLVMALWPATVSKARSAKPLRKLVRWDQKMVWQRAAVPPVFGNGILRCSQLRVEIIIRKLFLICTEHAQTAFLSLPLINAAQLLLQHGDYIGNNKPPRDEGKEMGCVGSTQMRCHIPTSNSGICRYFY